jgi:hypothetical protein
MNCALAGAQMQHGRPLNRIVRTHLNESTDLERHLRNLEEQLLEQDTRSSRAAVEALLTDDFVEFGSSGTIYDRTAVVSALATETPVQRSITQFKAVALADGVTLVTYVATTSGGQTSLRSSIWKRASGQWRMAFHQGTRVQTK